MQQVPPQASCYPRSFSQLWSGRGVWRVSPLPVSLPHFSYGHSLCVLGLLLLFSSCNPFTSCGSKGSLAPQGSSSRGVQRDAWRELPNFRVVFPLSGAVSVGCSFPSQATPQGLRSAPANFSSPLSVSSTPALPLSGCLCLQIMAGDKYCGRYQPLGFTFLYLPSSTRSTSAGTVRPLYLLFGQN